MPSDLSPPKATPKRFFNWGDTLQNQIENGDQSAPEFHSPLSRNGAENEAGKGPLLKAAEGVQENFWGGLKNIIDQFIPTVSQKRDIAVYGLALIIFVIAVAAILR